jgi:hypothetical protein
MSVEIISRRRGYPLPSDKKINADMSQPASHKTHSSHLTILSRRDFANLILLNIHSLVVRPPPLRILLQTPAFWRHTSPTNSKASSKVSRTILESEFPVSHSRSELPVCVEELITLVKRVFTREYRGKMKKTDLIDSIKNSHHLMLAGPSLIRFVLRSIRIFHRFGRFSYLNSLLMLLNAIIQNNKFDILFNFPEISASLVMLISTPNLLQSCSAWKQLMIRRIAVNSLLSLVDKLGAPHSQSYLNELARELSEVMSEETLGIRFLMQQANIQVV